MSIWPGARILHLVMLLTVLTQQSRVPAQIRPTVAVWAPAANQVLVGSQSGLQVCAWPMLTLQRQVPVEPQQILDLCLAGDQRRLLLTGGTAGESGMLQLLDLQTEQILLTCTPHTDRITQTCWLAADDRILTASDDGTAAVLDAQSGTLLQRVTLHSRPLLALTCFSGVQAVTAGMDGTIRLWQPQNGQAVRTFDNHTAPITDLLAPEPPADGMPLLYSASRDRTVRLWQPTRGRMVRFARLSSIPQVLLLTSGGDVLLVGCSDGSLLLLHPESLQVLRIEQTGTGGINALLQHPVSGDLLLCTDAGLLRLSRRQLIP